MFGPGFGESVLIHVGAGRWIIVDSCYKSGEAEPAPLSYLRSIGVDPATQVDLIVASHWHDDHARGLSRIMEACPSAIFSCPLAYGDKKVRMLGSLFKKRKREGKSGMSELLRVHGILAGRKIPPRYAQSGGELFRWPKKTGIHFDVSITALSPVDAAVKKTIQHFDSLMTDRSVSRGLVAPAENFSAIALRLDVGADESILLGSDLEASATYGWAVLVADPRFAGRKAFVYKVAHHGAASGHDAGKWSNFLHSQPYAFLTPYKVGGNSLPTGDDQKRLQAHTDKGYITSDPLLRPPLRRRSAVIARTLKDAAIHMTPAETLPGHIRFRFKPGDETTREVNEYEGAYKL